MGKMRNARRIVVLKAERQRPIVEPSVLSGGITLLKDRHYKYKVTVRRVRATIVAFGKTISITYSESMFVALGIQHAMCMRHTII
jgi:hypothetical protein